MRLRPSNHRYALVLQSPHHLEVRESSDSQALGPDEALVETMFVGMCGTDLEVIDGLSDRTRPPVILGHEWAGRVAAVGAAANRTLLDTFVVGDNLVPCGKCGPCSRGDSYGCPRNREVGFELPGGFASHFVTTARNLRPVPDFLRGPWASLIEPLAVCVHAARSACLEASDFVLVLGDGVIGLFLARISSLSGTRSVTLVGKHDDRMLIARDLGIQGACLQPDFQSQLANGRRAWPVVFEASGTATGLKTALEVAANKARVVLAGDYGSAAVPMVATTVVRKELRLIGSNASPGAWDEAVRLASTGAVNLRAVSLLVLPFDQWRAALAAARERRAPRVVLRHRTAEPAFGASPGWKPS